MYFYTYKKNVLIIQNVSKITKLYCLKFYFHMKFALKYVL